MRALWVCTLDFHRSCLGQMWSYQSPSCTLVVCKTSCNISSIFLYHYHHSSMHTSLKSAQPQPLPTRLAILVVHKPMSCVVTTRVRPLPLSTAAQSKNLVGSFVLAAPVSACGRRVLQGHNCQADEHACHSNNVHRLAAMSGCSCKTLRKVHQPGRMQQQGDFLGSTAHRIHHARAVCNICQRIVHGVV